MTRLSASGLIAIFFMFGGGQAHALDPSLKLSQYMVDQWQTPEGLPQNEADTIARTPDGYLWIGTQEGLARFDGVRFVVFNRSNEAAIPNDLILVLHVDRAGRLWIGTQDGMAVLENGRFKTYNAVAGLAHVPILSIIEDHTGRFWVGTDNGLVQIDQRERGRVFGISDGLRDTSIRALLEDREGMIWVATANGGRSKDEGRNQYHFHSDDLDREVLDRFTLGGEIKRAIEGNEFELEYQPQVELASQNIVGMEALIRWNHPTRGLLAPGLFIPIAEKTGTIVALGHWVLDQACRQMSIWRKEQLQLPVIAVNLSLFQLKSGQELVSDVIETLAKWGLAPSDLEFDVTEATLAQLTWTQNPILPQLRELGVKIAIDDFGSEYSSFDYVRAYRVNHLKIAQSFISRSTTDSASAATIRAIVNFARDIGIVVIAQGVETEQQRDLLTLTDVTTQAQGFHFSKAVGAQQASEMLRQGRAGVAEQSSSEQQISGSLSDRASVSVAL